MSMKWEMNHLNDHLCRDLSCAEYRIDDNHSVMILRRDNTYDSYVMEKLDGEPLGTPFLYMFGTEVGSMPYHKIVDMTIANAPDYYDLFEEA